MVKRTTELSILRIFPCLEGWCLSSIETVSTVSKNLDVQFVLHKCGSKKANILKKRKTENRYGCAGYLEERGWPGFLVEGVSRIHEGLHPSPYSKQRNVLSPLLITHDACAVHMQIPCRCVSSLAMRHTTRVQTHEVKVLVDNKHFIFPIHLFMISTS